MNRSSITDQPDQRRDRNFTRLVGITAGITFALIVVGAITRVTKSGMGCGTYWPDCNGKIIPEFATIEEVIEMVHRIIAALVGFFMLAVGVQTWRYYRHRPYIYVPVLAMVLIFAVQIGLGALTVKLSNQWVSVLVHLGNALLVLTTLLIAWANSHYAVHRDTWLRQSFIRIPLIELILMLISSFLVILVGAAVAGNEATKACIGWPLCHGELWPFQQGPLQQLNMLHRLVVGGLGILLLLAAVQLRGGGNPLLSQWIGWALVLYLIQCVMGLLVVLISDRDFLTASRALHVMFAAATWSALVIASAVSWLQRSPNAVTINEPVTTYSATI